MSLHHNPLILALFSALLATLVSAAAATTTSVYPSAAASGVTPGAGSNGYTYIGCWNETTGYTSGGDVRALSGGTMESTNNLTTSSCLTFCANSSAQYCGMEYGRECWAAPYLSVLSTELSASNCSDACVGNASEICGGSLTITLYNLTGTAKSGAASWRGGVGPNRHVLAMGFAGAMGLGLLFAL